MYNTVHMPFSAHKLLLLKVHTPQILQTRYILYVFLQQSWEYYDKVAMEKKVRNLM